MHTHSFAGQCIGLDATCKLAARARVYSKLPTESGGTTKSKTITNQLAGGGLLTGVNEDKELVICVSAWSVLHLLQRQL